MTNTQTSFESNFSFNYVLSDEIQKGINAVQQCKIENQKGDIAVQSLWR